MASSASVGLRRSPFMSGIIYDTLRSCQYECFRSATKTAEYAENAEKYAEQ
jgi:hypothetical protein